MAQVTLKIKLEDDASQNLMKIRDELNKLGDANKPATDGNDKFKKSLITGAVAGATAMAVSKVTSAIKGMVSDVMKASDALDAYDYTLSTMGYGKEQIKKSQATMRDFAKNSVYDLTSVIGTAQSLATNGVKDFEAVTKGLGGFNAIAGGTKETFNTLSNGLMKVNGEGKLTNEVWNSFQSALKGTKMQDLENELRNITGETGNFKEALTKGKISANDMNTAIKNMGLTDEAQEFVKGTAFFEGAIENLKSNVFDGLLTIFEELKPSITAVTNALAKVADVVFKVIGSAVSFISANKDWLLPLIVGFTAFNVASKIASVGLLAFLKGLPLVTGATKAAAVAQAAFNAVMDANPLVKIVTVISIVISLVVVMYNKFDWFRNFVDSIFPALADTFKAVWEGVKVFFVTIFDLWSSIISAFADFFINLWNGISIAFTTIWDGLKAIVMISVNMWLAIFSTVYNFLIVPFQNAFNTIKGIFDNLKNIVSNVVSNISSTFQKIVSAITTPIRNAVNTAKGILNTLTGAVSTVIRGIGSGISGMFTSAVNSIKGIINNFMISPLNSAIGIINAIPGVNIPSIPMLATGGIIDGATLAIVGEAGREAVVPMTNKSVMSQLANEINKYRGVSVPSNNGSTNNNTNNEYIFNVTTQNFDEKSIKRFLLREAKGCGY